jgi:hypothetical protein
MEQYKTYKAEPCIYTRETGKHEMYLLHAKHQANAPFWIPTCPACGWIDVKQMMMEIPFWRLVKLRLGFWGDV